MSLPPLTDHAFMKLLRARVECGYPMTCIAREVGADVDDLCDWIMKYKEPHRPKAYLRRDGPPIPPRSSDDAQRLANWRRQKEAAAAARKSIAVPVRYEGGDDDPRWRDTMKKREALAR